MERLIREIRTGSKPATGPVAVADPVYPPLPTLIVGASDRNAFSSERNLSWFSRSWAVTARRWESLIGSRPSCSRRGAHFSCRCSALNICVYLMNVYVCYVNKVEITSELIWKVPACKRPSTQKHLGRCFRSGLQTHFSSEKT